MAKHKKDYKLTPFLFVDPFIELELTLQKDSRRKKRDNDKKRGKKNRF